MVDTQAEFHADLIVALGGKAKLAEALDLDRDVLSKWHRRGIPSRYWHEIIRLANAAGRKIVADDLAKTKPTSKRPATEMAA